MGLESSEGRTGHSHSLPLPSPHTTQPQVVLTQPQQPIAATQQTLTSPTKLSTKLPKYAFVTSVVATLIFAVLCWVPGLFCLVPATVMSIIVSNTLTNTHHMQHTITQSSWAWSQFQMGTRRAVERNSLPLVVFLDRAKLCLTATTYHTLPFPVPPLRLSARRRRTN